MMPDPDERFIVTVIASPGSLAGVNSGKQSRAQSPMPLWISPAVKAAS